MQEQKTNYSQLLNSSNKVSVRDVISGNPTQFNSQYQIINLPSKGWGYQKDNPLSSGEIKIKIPTGREQALLSSQQLIKKGIMIDQFLKSLIIYDGINYDDLLLGDKNYIIFAARRLTYGDDYNVQIECQKCGQKQKVNIDLSKIPFKQTPELFEYDKGKTIFQYELPISKKKVFFKLNTHKLQKQMQTRIKNEKRPDLQILIRTAVLIQSIDGKQKFKDILNELYNISSKDSIALRNHIKKLSPDILISKNHQCKSCYTQQEVYIPITVQFFWPSDNS